MADQKRWFKLWCSAPSDDDLLALPPDLRWAWAVLGCYTKEHGTLGRVKLSASNVVLAAQMGVSALALRDTISLLPHLHIEEGISDNGAFTVTWKNWKKYQEDSTVYERVKRLRSKRRGEENKNRRDKEPPSLSPPVNGFHIHVSILEALDACPHFAHVHRLRSAAYWQAQITAYNTHFPTELRKAEAWLAANPTRAPHKDMARFLSNWFAKAHEEPAP